MTLEQNPSWGNLAERIEALPSPDARVRMYWCRLGDDAPLATRLREWLSPAEHARAARFGDDALRRRHVIGRGMLRAILGSVLGVPPPLVALARGRRGRPMLAMSGGPDFNVSHTGDVLLAAVGLGVTVGVDVERGTRSINVAGLARRCLTADEREELVPLDPDAARRRILQIWTCKEAMSKATGDALSARFAQLDVGITPAPHLRGGPHPYDPSQWSLHAIAAPGDHFATLATWNGRPADLA